MNTLNVIQKLAKIGKVLSRIAFAAGIVAMVLCMVGIPCLILIPDGIRVGGMKIYGIVGVSDEINAGSAYLFMIFGIIFGAAECVIARKAQRYFEHQLAAGTPFTLEGSRQMMNLGIYTICLSVAAAAASFIAYKIMIHYFDGIKDYSLTGYNQVTEGIAFILTALVFRYGAEQRTRITE